MENSQGQAKEAHDQEQAYRQHLNQRLLDFEEHIEWLGGRMSQYLEGLLERKEVEEPQQLHKSTNPFFCLTLGGIKPVDSLSSSECNLGDVLLGFGEEPRVEKERKEVEKPDESSKTVDDYLDEFLLILDEDKDFKGDGRGKTEMGVEVALQNKELISQNNDLILKVNSLEKERDLAMKKSQELSALVVEQEIEFSRRMRGMQVEMEKKDHALKVAQVVVCDYIVDLDKDEHPIKALEKKGIKRRSTKKPLTTQSGASLLKVVHKQVEAMAKVNKGSISNFSPTCYFCHIRGHKRAQCAKYVELCKNRNMLRRKVRKVREVWIRKDKLDQLK